MGKRVFLVCLVLLVIATAVVVALTRFREHLPTPAIGKACAVTTGSGTVELTYDQMANAATIAAVGLRKHLPDRAVVVALATAFQESKLENLTNGDRDSLGLFQQRPSQGWGEPDQILDPRYAATKFYNALVRVRGWENMRVTDAAQRVQRSAFPEAYEKWADDAAVLAEALAGRASSAVACTQYGEPLRRGVDATQSLGSMLRLDWGNVSTAATNDVGLAVTAATEQSGWQYAHWIVAHSAANGVEKVRFAGSEWSADDGAWRLVDGPAESDRVVAQVYGVA